MCLLSRHCFKESYQSHPPPPLSQTNLLVASGPSVHSKLTQVSNSHTKQKHLPKFAIFTGLLHSYFHIINHHEHLSWFVQLLTTRGPCVWQTEWWWPGRRERMCVRVVYVCAFVVLVAATPCVCVWERVNVPLMQWGEEVVAGLN